MLCYTCGRGIVRSCMDFVECFWRKQGQTCRKIPLAQCPSECAGFIPYTGYDIQKDPKYRKGPRHGK